MTVERSLYTDGLFFARLCREAKMTPSYNIFESGYVTIEADTGFEGAATVKVHGFAKQLGFPASKVRYYDRMGLIQSGRAKNNYREFTPEDALDIYHAQMLRSFDMSIQETLAARTADLGEIDGWVARHMGELEESIRWQEIKLMRLQEMRDYFSMMGDTSAILHVVERDDSFNVWNFGCAGALPGVRMETVEALTAAMPFSYIAIRVSRESVLGGGALDVSIGPGILERNRAKLRISIPPEIEKLPGSPILEYLFELPDPFAIQKKDLAPLLEEMERRDIPMEEDLIGRIYFSYVKNGAFVHGIGLGAAMRKK